MKTLKIDDKFSIVYNENNNNHPLYVKHHGSRHTNMRVYIPNWITSMFYSLLEHEQRYENTDLGNIEIYNTQLEAEKLGKLIHYVGIEFYANIVDYE